jgi:restriction endonuclease
MDEKRELDALAKRVAEEVWQTETTGQLTCRPLKLVSKSGEEEEAFRARCEAAADDAADDEIAALKDKVEAKADKLEDRIRAQDAKLREALGTLSARRAEEAVNVGETLLSWFTGRKKSVSTAATKRRMSSSASEKVDQAEAALDDLKDELAELERGVAEQIEAIRAKHREVAAEIDRKEIRLKRSDVTVETLAVLWIPVTRRL